MMKNKMTVEQANKIIGGKNHSKTCLEFIIHSLSNDSRVPRQEDLDLLEAARFVLENKSK